MSRVLETYWRYEERTKCVPVCWGYRSRARWACTRPTHRLTWLPRRARTNAARRGDASLVSSNSARPPSSGSSRAWCCAPRPPIPRLNSGLDQMVRTYYRTADLVLAREYFRVACDDDGSSSPNQHETASHHATSRHSPDAHAVARPRRGVDVPRGLLCAHCARQLARPNSCARYREVSFCTRHCLREVWRARKPHCNAQHAA